LNRSCFTGYSNQEIFSQRGAGLVPAESLAFNSYARTIAPVTDPIMADGHANREQGVLVPSEPLGFDTYNQRVTGHVAHPLRNTNGTFGDALPAVLVPAEHSPAKPAVLPFDPRQIAHPANFSRPTFGAPSHPLRAVANAEPAVVIQRAPEMHVAFKPSHYTRGKDGAPSEVAPPLSADADKGDQDPVVLTVAFQSNQGTRGGNVFEEVSPTVRVAGNGRNPPAVLSEPAIVRRLTVTECERLQGFPDGYTNVPYRNKPAADGPRYKALGNSMAVPVMRWIGQRIARIDAI
jgi:hypothetical protein